MFPSQRSKRQSGNLRSVSSVTGERSKDGMPERGSSDVTPVREWFSRSAGFEACSKRAWAYGLGALLLGCSSVAEWEEKPGKVELFATPLPPVAGKPLVLGLRASNVGPIEVFQGDTVVATFFNIDLKQLKAYEVEAASSKTPRAEAVAFDHERIKVNAVVFDGAPPAVEPDLSPTQADAATTEDTPVEACPGLTEVSDGRCSQASGPARVSVTNTSDSPLSVYEQVPGAVDATQCVATLRALVPVGVSRDLDTFAGAVLRVVADVSATTVRTVQIPAVERCEVVVH